MAIELDQSQPYATFMPIHEGARYEQNGIRFDAHGKALGQTVEAPALKTKPEPKPKTVEPAEVDQLSKQLSGN